MSNPQTTQSGPDRSIVARSPKQVLPKKKFSRAALLVAPFVAAFAIGFGVSRALNSEGKNNGQSTSRPPAKRIPLACSRDYAPHNSGQYYFDERGRLQEGYVVTDERGKTVLCPPTWNRNQK